MIIFPLVVGFNQTSYTVFEGTESVVILSILRKGHLDSTTNVTVIAQPGTADGKVSFCIHTMKL